jgi:pimeloyl-ACP methyl ester carboxylesterase
VDSVPSTEGVDEMRKRVVNILLVALVMSAVPGSQAFAQTRPTPPGRPAQGYGSTQKYICDGYQRIKSGWYWDGTAVNVFVPNRLKCGRRAPVVFFLHGFLQVAPQIYLDAIKHLTDQGYIVIYPTINPGNPFAILTDMDQNVMLQRAIDNARKGLAIAGRRADTSKMFVFGHSLGGLFSVCWNGAGGPRARAIVSCNLATDSMQGMPDFLKQFVKITPVDWRGYAAEVDVPVILLTGDEDNISGVKQATDMYNALTAAPSRALHCLRTDNYGDPRLAADHNAVMCSSGWIPPLLMRFFGGDAEVDATDYRYYWAAFDAVLEGKTALTFDMGAWSDGTPVKPVLQLAP